MGFSAALATAALSALGTVASVSQASQQRARQQDQQKKMSQYNAAIAQAQADQALEEGRAAKKEGYDAAVQKRQQTASIIGTQRALQGASGAQVEQGSGLDATLDTAEKGEIDALAARQRGLDADYTKRSSAWRLQQSANASQAQAAYLADQQSSARIGDTVTLLNGLERTGQNFYRLTNSSGIRG